MADFWGAFLGGVSVGGIVMFIVGVLCGVLVSKAEYGDHPASRWPEEEE